MPLHFRAMMQSNNDPEVKRDGQAFDLDLQPKRNILSSITNREH
jgi:hypothetical protein